MRCLCRLWICPAADGVLQGVLMLRGTPQLYIPQRLGRNGIFQKTATTLELPKFRNLQRARIVQDVYEADSFGQNEIWKIYGNSTLIAV